MTTTAITVHAPYDATRLATLQATAEADALALVGFEVEAAEMYQLADELLTAKLQERDAAEAAKKAITTPIRAGLKAVDDLFRPLMASLDACVGALKGPMARYQASKALEERQARAKALEAAKADDHATMALALTQAAEVSAPVAGVGSAVRWSWVVTGIVPDLVPDEYWVVDEKRVAAVARAWPGAAEEGPVVPGVTFTRVAGIAGRH